jgi:hypothetical protein
MPLDPCRVRPSVCFHGRIGSPRRDRTRRMGWGC